MRQLPGADAPASRLGHPDDDAWTEVYVAARLIRAGVSVELEPTVGSRKPDCRFRMDDRWAYVEVTIRGSSARVLRSAQALLNQIAEDAAGAVPGHYRVVAILRKPRANETTPLRQWLRNCGDGRAAFDDRAIYDSLAWDSANKPPGVTFAPGEPRLWAIHATNTGLKGSASMPVVDSGAAQVLRPEAKQLPRGEAGVVCIEMTTLVGHWKQ